MNDHTVTADELFPVERPKTRADERREMRAIWKKTRRRMLRQEGVSRRKFRKMQHEK